ncbi:hypothetical protein ILYODFUR_016971 [Ilyodon furcidens]|uniref:Uncharacterized protein n=1 Tax=Ilyodon furcidens TaxID=33524 RepID=A0ABV0UU58_9TELE
MCEQQDNILGVHPSLHFLYPLLPYRVVGELVPVYSGLRARGWVHPGQMYYRLSMIFPPPVEIQKQGKFAFLTAPVPTEL